MLRKDLIMRQFEEFGKVLAALLSLRKAANFTEFENELEKASVVFLEIEFSSFLKDDTNQFLQIVSALAPEKKKMLARLLYEKMLLAEQQANIDYAQGLAEKSKIAYELYQNDQTHLEYDLDAHYKLQELRNRIN